MTDEEYLDRLHQVDEQLAAGLLTAGQAFLHRVVVATEHYLSETRRRHGRTYQPTTGVTATDGSTPGRAVTTSRH